MSLGPDLAHGTLADLSRLLAARQVSAVELARTYLARIEAQRELNAFLDVRPEVTLAQAAAADARIARGDATPLTGIPIAHKDIFVTKDFPSTASSKILKGYMSPFDATVVDNLSRAGMVTLGKLNCDEFAMGSSNENSAYGNVLNPWDHSAVPGGSSGGSAAAVAARIAPVATATDTGGSIREPAAFSGITGTKPTYGRPSRWGMIAFASSLDTAGLMTLSAEDAALVFNAMLGFDPKDSTSLDRPAEDYTRSLGMEVRASESACPRSSSARVCSRTSKSRYAPRSPSTRSSVRSWSRSRCPTPSSASLCITSSHRPKRRATSRASMACATDIEQQNIPI